MASSKAMRAGFMLASWLFVLSTALVATPARAVNTDVAAVVTPNAAKGAGFGTVLLGQTSQLVATVHAPMDYTIQEITKRDGGTGFWVPAEGNPTLPAEWQGYEAYGIGRDDDHSVGFYGVLSRGGGPGGTPPDFDIAVADLRIADHEAIQSDGSGLAVAPAMVSGAFPAQLPANTGRTTTFTVTTRWGGPQDLVGVGQVVFAVPPGVAVYSDSGSIVSAYTDAEGVYHAAMACIVPPGGISGEQITIVTNDAFSGAGSITATFTWSEPFASESASAITAVDYLRVAAPTLQVHAVGFSGSGYNTMNKNGSDSYYHTGMTYKDDGDTPVGWTLTWPPQSPLFGDGHRWHVVDIPDVFLGGDPACFTGGTTPHVAVLAYVSTPHEIPTLRVRGEVSDTNPGGYMSGTAQDVPSGNSYQIVESDLSDPWQAKVVHGSLSFDWYYDLDDRLTPNVQFYPGGDYPVWVTLGTPTGTAVTAKRVKFVCSEAADQDQVTPCADAIYDALAGRRPVFDLGGGNPINRWFMMDPGGPSGECIALAMLMQDMCRMLGLGDGEIGYIYGTTDNDCYSTSDDAFETRVCPGGVHGDEEIAYYAGGGWNNWEAVFSINAWYYAVKETKSQTPVNIIKTILGANDPGGEHKGNHQAWVGAGGGTTCCEVPGPHPAPLPD